MPSPTSRRSKILPNCGLKLTDHDIEEIIKKMRDKEKLLRLFMRLVEEIGTDTLKKLLISH